MTAQEFLSLSTKLFNDMKAWVAEASKTDTLVPSAYEGSDRSDTDGERSPDNNQRWKIKKHRLFEQGNDFLNRPDVVRDPCFNARP